MASTVAAQQLAQLKGFPSLDGIVCFPDDTEYDDKRKKCYAKQHHYERPCCIVDVQSIGDVQKAVKWAAENEVQVAVRSGSHSYTASYLIEDTLLLDLGALNQISNIDPVERTAVIGPGVAGEELNRQLAAYRLCFSSGHCAGVKLGGFLVGGGYGWFGDSFGMAADSIVECTLVTAEGEIVKVKDPSADDEDWMWLLRGSGVYFPAILVEAKLAVHPLPEILERRSWVYPVEAYPSLVEHISSCREDEALTAKMETAVILAILPKLGKVTIVGIACAAESEEEIEQMVAIVKPVLPPLSASSPKRFHHFGEMAQANLEMSPEHWFYHCSYSIMPHQTCPEWSTIVADLFVNMASKEGYSQVLTVVPNTKRFPSKSDKSAYGPHALGSIVLGHYGMYENAGTDDETTAKKWLLSVNEALETQAAARPFKRSVLEDPSFSIPAMFPGSAGERLVALCKKFDPTGVFATPSG
mmetsp:Transcript_27790/g.40939  ORF Transcript_27790/g.40939 Transcript_27790/m.40939 type:complete len:470 (-) Transcript_27790:671-2080(-)|eukprot:CAMPEP_0194042190 /NCGR_PEP_ID=MMETSP0009_2-20130614/13985_1 /TAXON_ID=210454 /ORGANISM="Grammatophora oceanica, Strain CCMP 410" /LENGTH=469 /DNA_ID=CAMNT_0038685943 /DNA_START=146 /DNA_END=1555 /DNA_ORIENTATION=-